MKTKQDNDVIDSTCAIYTKNDTKLSWPIGSGAHYDKHEMGKLYDWSCKCDLHRNEIEMSWPIILGLIYDENLIGQRRDRLYRFGQCRNQNWSVKTYLTVCSLWWNPYRKMIWPIIQMQSMPKTKLSCHDWFVGNLELLYSHTLDRVGCTQIYPRLFKSIATDK